MKISYQLLIVAIACCSSCEKSEIPVEKPSITPAVASPSAPNTPESIAQEVVTIQNQISAIMESIQDVPTAEKAIVALGPVAERFNAIGKVIEGMGKETSPELDARLKELVKPAEERLQNAMAKAMPILTQNPDLAEKMQATMSKISSN